MAGRSSALFLNHSLNDASANQTKFAAQFDKVNFSSQGGEGMYGKLRGEMVFLQHKE